MYISTGCPVIDKILGGGIPLGFLTFIYGEVGSGKTSLALQIACQTALSDRKFIYIDALGKISSRRVKDIMGYLDERRRANGLFIIIKNFQELHNLSLELEYILNPRVSLIVIDVLTRPYRLALGTKAVNVKLNKMLNQIMAMLYKIVRYYNVALLALGDVRVTPEGEEPVAIKIIEYWSDIIIHIMKAEIPNRRTIMVEKHFIKELEGMKAICIISRNGLRGVRIEGSP
ncbi:MAG: hypothetical protein DRJ66_01755 [Thermoprotei archaeon]|nr:MAG: hypothetical protein DRJ66_01755 [Thermoprotei archaeon]RLF19511.1 MAG: hypothetical protein DRZ82_05415 [Thermoprotei archaeon]